MLLVAGAHSLALAVKIDQGGPIVVSPAKQRRVAMLALLPAVLVPAAGTALRSMARPEDCCVDPPYVPLLAGLGLLFVAQVALLLAVATGHYWLFNVTARMVLAALDAALRRRAPYLQVTHNYHRLEIPQVGASVRLIVEADGRAWLRVRHERRIPGHESLAADIGRELRRVSRRERPYEGWTPAPLFYILGVVTLGLATWGLLEIVAS
jgi:hypothetical protein